MLQLDLTGKIALVTGASGELGRVITRALADGGADVAIHYLGNEGKARAVKEEVSAMGRRAEIFQADVSSQVDVFRMRDEISTRLGSPDIVVLNAVIQYEWKSILDQSIEDYEGQFRTCILQSVLLAKAFVPSMQKKKWGRYIAINTECSLFCRPGESAYVSAKRGMDGVMRVLTREAGPHGVTVNQVAPGWMISDKYRDGGERQPEYEALIPLRKRGYDTDIAKAVVFLASEHAGFISGAFLPVCGGNVMVGI